MVEVLRYFMQLLLSYPAVMFASIPFSFLLSAVGLSGEHPSHVYFAGYRALLCLFVGTAIGWGVGRKVPLFVATGRWIWVLPTFFFSLEIAHELTFQPIPRPPESFFAVGPAIAGLTIDLFTLPASSALGYSIGMALLGTNSGWSKLARLQPKWRVVTVTVACVALFSALATLAHQFEHSKIERWSRVRSVIDKLWLSPDPSLVCSGPTSENGTLLKGAIMVEGLERRVCGKDRLLDAGAPRPAGSWVVERVKVLNGPNAGVQGWVLEYGLLETMRP